MSETPQFYRDFFPEPSKREVVGRPLDPSRAVPYAAKAINAELEGLARAPEGERNATLNKAAFNLAQLVAGGYADHNEVWDLLRSTSLLIGLTASETDKTLHSAFESGSRQPRVVAELDNEGPPPVTVFHVEQPAAVAQTDAETEQSIEALFPRLDWDDLWSKEDKEEWIVEPLIPARRLVALFSPPKVGKSLLMLELAVQISRGHMVLGVTPPPKRVLYVDFENDPRGDIRSRLKAMGMTPGDLKDLVYLSFPSLPYLDTAMGGLQLLAVAQYYGCEVIIIDTISRAVGGEENANDTWLGFYRNTGILLKNAGIACIRLDHSGKDESKGMRGGSAKYGDVDAVWSMKRVGDSETFELECTANRLPILEKTLVLHREEEPHLHHRVDARGEVGAWAVKRDERIACLDRVFGTAPVAVTEALEALRSAGLGMRPQALRESLLPERERRHGRHGLSVVEES